MVEPVRLSAFATPTNRIYRCLFLCGESRFSACETEHGTPLFLGCDVLAGSRVSPNHYSRTHARFAVRGAACKLVLGVKLEGINSTDALWFYTVRGVFQVTFELHDYAVQQDVMQSMREMWDNHGSYSPVATELQLSWSASPEPSADMPGKQQLLQQQHRPSRQPSPTVTSAAATAIGTLAQLLLQTSASLATCASTASAGSIFIGRLQALLRCAAAAAATSSQATDSEPRWMDQETASAWLDHALSVWHKMAADNGKLRDGWPPELRPCLPLSSHRLVVMTAVCEVVGEQLASLQQVVADRAEQFKKAHLHSIDSLPPARALVAELFPDCMVRLLVAWMRGGAGGSGGVGGRAKDSSRSQASGEPVQQQQRPGACQQSHAICCEKSGEPVRKLPKQTSAPESEHLYPFVQLILEFATNCLVSGVAHVLYSRLLHSVT